MSVPHTTAHPSVQTHLWVSKIKTWMDCILQRAIEKLTGREVVWSHEAYYKKDLKVQAISDYLICVNFAYFSQLI